MNSTRKLLAAFARETVDLLTGKRVAPADGADAPPLVPGYLVQKLVGQGGFASVYLVRSIEGEQFALKVLHAGSEDPIGEAEAAISHPNIVAVRAHDVMSSGRPYLVTEYCPGGSVADRLGALPADHRQVADILRQLAGALAAIHGAKYVHGDLSPNNILFDAAAVPKIADFGLAKPVNPGTRISTATGVAGTPNYAAPERYDGIDTDPRSDVYSLGAVGYAMLTGRPPYGPVGPGASARSEPAPIPLRQLVPDLPRGLAFIIHRCLDPNRAYRYQTARRVAAELERFLNSGWVVRTRLIRGWRRATYHVRRNWGLYLLLLAVVGVLWGVEQSEQRARTPKGWLVKRRRSARKPRRRGPKP